MGLHKRVNTDYSFLNAFCMCMCNLTLVRSIGRMSSDCYLAVHRCFNKTLHRLVWSKYCFPNSSVFSSVLAIAYRLPVWMICYCVYLMKHMSCKLFLSSNNIQLVDFAYTHNSIDLCWCAYYGLLFVFGVQHIKWSPFRPCWKVQHPLTFITSTC